MGSQTARVAVMLLLGAALVWGCESSDVLAPSGSQIIIEANPQTVIIDVDAGESQGQSVITAQLFDSTGAFPLEGVDVIFSTNGGTLASSDNTCGTGGICSISGGACTTSANCPAVAGQNVRTDGNGVATDILTLGLQDASTVNVSVRSSTITASVTVTKTVVEGNVQPTADISASPAGAQVLNGAVVFDGRGSSDPDGSGITCYQWTIVSTDSSGDEVVQGASESLVSRRYSVEQELSVTLRVSDRDDAATFCVPGVPADTSFFSPNVDFIDYAIVCDLTPPVAAAGADRSVPLVAGSATVSLSSNGSSDAQSGISAYSWICTPTDPNPQTTQNATCTYTAAGTYVAQLTVTNGCGMTASDSVSITVTNL